MHQIFRILSIVALIATIYGNPVSKKYKERINNAEADNVGPKDSSVIPLPNNDGIEKIISDIPSERPTQETNGLKPNDKDIQAIIPDVPSVSSEEGTFGPKPNNEDIEKNISDLPSRRRTEETVDPKLNNENTEKIISNISPVSSKEELVGLKSNNEDSKLSTLDGPIVSYAKPTEQTAEVDTELREKIAAFLVFGRVTPSATRLVHEALQNKSQVTQNAGATNKIQENESDVSAKPQNCPKETDAANCVQYYFCKTYLVNFILSRTTKEPTTEANEYDTDNSSSEEETDIQGGVHERISRDTTAMNVNGKKPNLVEFLTKSCPSKDILEACCPPKDRRSVHEQIAQRFADFIEYSLYFTG